MTIYFVRHGETPWNAEGKLQGSADVPLNETGLSQARILSEKLKDTPLDLALCSPLTRARQTAEVICSPRFLPLLEEEALKERNFGVLEGSAYTDFDKCWDIAANWDMETGEPWSVFYRRVSAFLDSLPQRFPPQVNNILLVSHGGVSIAVQYYFHKIPPDAPLSHCFLKNCQVARFDLPARP
jgi:broad specificity phosphatase PhoE